MSLTPLQYRILELSYKHKLSHIGSCISTLPILEHIYAARKPDEPVCLGNAHAGLALYCVIEANGGANAEMLLEKHGIHATRDMENGIYVSGGSLGQVETIAMGMALAKPERKVWLVSSDGGAAEGAFWETLSFKGEHGVDNLRWYINANGYAAYRSVWHDRLKRRIAAMDCGVWTPDVWDTFQYRPQIPFLSGLDAHYYVMTEADWQWVQQQEITK